MTSPWSGAVKPATTISVVVFPEPEAPSRVTNSPDSRSSETASTAAGPEPYRFDIWRMETEAPPPRRFFTIVSARIAHISARREIGDQRFGYGLCHSLTVMREWSILSRLAA